MLYVKADRAIVGIFLLFAVTLPTAQADSLEGAELAAYDTYCPVGNYRAVWAEPLPDNFVFGGLVNLVCLNEDEQETSFWYVTPEGTVVSSDEIEFPVRERPIADAHVIESINDLADDEIISLELSFKYDEPDVPSLAAYGLPENFYLSSGSSTGGFGQPTESFYQVNGVEVTQAEYEQWNALFLAATQAQEAERTRLVIEQVHLSLYDLVDINQWHDWIDVEAVNNGNTDNPRWEYRNDLVITLTGIQSRTLLQRSEELVYVSIYYGATDGGNEGTILPSETSDILVQNEPTDETARLDQNNDSILTGGSGGGFFHPASLLAIFCIGFGRRSRTRR